MGPVKNLAYWTFAKCIAPLPLKRGKSLIGRLFVRLFGRPVWTVNGLKLELDPAAIIDRNLMMGKGHDELVHDIIRSHLRSGDVFVDVGAHVGYFSLLAARTEGIHVLAFEPSPRELKRFYVNMALNELPGTVTVFPYGLAAEEKTLPLHLSGDGNPSMNSTLDLGKFMKYVTTVSCQFMPFHRLVPDTLAARVRVCKIDVEGFELDVLRGMQQSISQMRNAVFVVEVSPAFMEQIGQHPREIYEFFAEAGFEPRFGLQEGKYQYDEIFEPKSVSGTT